MNSTRDLAILFALSTEARLGPRAILALLAHFGDPETLWNADLDEIAKVAELTSDNADRFSETRTFFDNLEQELQFIIDAGTEPISILDHRYPERLRRLANPPIIIYVRGELPDPTQTAVAVVGTHLADADGIADAVAWGKGLSTRDVLVVSGLARGIDGGGHTGALATDGKTVAVLGAGFDHIYPPEHKILAERIEQSGALISEYPPRERLTKPRLIRRNRIIVALSDAVVVVRLHKDARGSMEAIRRARDLATPTFLVASDTETISQQAITEGAIPISREPDFDLVLKYL